MRRQAARVVLLDPADRVLLLAARDPTAPGKGGWWELPGGGVEPGEETGSAAARELHEETGISGAEMGPCVWRHHARFTFAGMSFDQHEHIHVARCPDPGLSRSASGVDYRPAGLEALEAMAFEGFRWWPPAELDALVRSGGRIIPPWLPEQLPIFLADGFPPEPIYLGELGPVV